MEDSQPTSSFLKQNKINLIILAFILFVGTLLGISLNKNAFQLKTNLLPGNAVVYDMKLRSGDVTRDGVALVFMENSNSTNSTGYYTGEVAYSVRYFTGEVKTNELEQKWPEFTDISYFPPGIQEESGEKKITAVGLQADTQYSFAVLKNDLPNNTSHFSNTLNVRTSAGTSPQTNKNVNPIRPAALPAAIVSDTEGDVNGDGSLDGWDPYSAVMYIYYNNWTALLASLQSQGLVFGSDITESEFKKRTDLDRNCIINFSDVDLLSQLTHNKTLPVSGQNPECVY